VREAQLGRDVAKGGGGARARAAALLELTKPGITRLVLMTTGAGYFLADPGGVEVLRMLHTLLGTALVASGTNALNQWWERGADGRMRRTSRRPLPSGRLGAGEALAFSLGISVVGLAYLLVLVDALTAFLVFLSLTSYVLVYTPLKRRHWVSTVVGSVPGALPILAGWTAAGGGLTEGGVSLFLLLAIWQLPHFYALAWIYREDYRRGGFRMVSLGDETGERTGRHILFSALVLLPVSLLPARYGVVGGLYVAGAVALGVAFLFLGARVWRRPTEQHAWGLFIGSVVYLPVILLLMVADRLVL